MAWQALTIGGQPLSEVLVRLRPELIDRVLEALVAELPAYREMPPEALNADIVHVVRLSLAVFLDALAAGHMPHGSHFDGLAESAARRAEEGIPLAAVMQAYHLSVRVVVARVAEEASADDLPHVVGAVQAALDLLTSVSRIVASSYLQVSRAISGVEADASAERLQDLLAGHVDPDLVGSHLVVRLNLGPHPDEALGGLGGDVASNRKVRRVRAQIVIEDDAILSSVTATSGVLLIPISEGADNPLASGLIERLQRAAGADVWAVSVAAPTPERVASASRMAVDILGLVHQLGRPAGHYRLQDVAVEYQLTRPGPARTLLADTLDPIAGREDLLTTLGEYLRQGQDRRATAAALHLHPNTVDYRLQRVHALLGTDPTDGRQVAPLIAAILARAAEHPA